METLSFRDHIPTVDESGKRRHIYAKQPAGAYYNARTILAVVYLVLFFGMPFIEINGHPFLLLNFPERKFILFGFPFWPQDFYLAVTAFITLVVSVALFTVIFGRIFCGWICPQTVFMEMVFRRIEYWIEGNAAAQQRLAQRPYDTDKIIRKAAKHSLFFIFSFLVGNTFLAYIIGITKLKEIVLDNPVNHWQGLGLMLAFTSVFYMVFSQLREQVCLVACPYGRLQGILVDRNTMTVAYDYNRGEPRGKMKSKEKLGDCIDCKLCTAVCPTGIDIRNGANQLECIGCTACIDACNEVMRKINKPTGLIRYDSELGISTQQPFRYTLKAKAYSGLLVLLLSGLITLLVTRSDTQISLLRIPGTLYQTLPNNNIANVYQLRILNKTFDPMTAEIRVLSPSDAKISFTQGNATLQIPGQASVEGVLLVECSRKSLTGMKTPLELGIFSGEKRVTSVKTQFLGPTTVN